MTTWIYLSYPLDTLAPAYGGGDAFKVDQEKQIVLGDSCNTSKWTLPNHMGTHIDFPRHFSKTGLVLDDYNPGFFILKNVHVADISPIQPGRIIGPNDLNFSRVRENIELLIIKTGFGSHRQHPVYWQENPGFHPNLAEQLRKTFPMLRIVGFESISLTSFTNRRLGREAHKAFLNNARPILPLEDIDLTGIDNNSKIVCVIVAPMQVRGADGAPCTVLAEID